MDKLTEALGYTPQKIAIFRAIKLGDLLCSIPAFRALRAAFPQAHIALISLPWAEEFVQCYPQYFDEFIHFPGWPGLPEQPIDPESTVHFLEQMQRRKWDVVFQLQGDGTLVNVMLPLLNPGVLAGYYRPDLRAEQWVAQVGLVQAYPEQAHEIKRHVGLMNFLGIPSQGYDLDFNLTETDRQEARQYLNQLGVSPGRFVCIHAGGISGRRWPEEKFAAVADKLAAQDHTIVLTGTLSEKPIAELVRATMRHPAVSIVGKTSLHRLAAIVAEATLVVSNDTGVAHLAVACQSPSIVIFTSADPAEWGPLNQIRHRIVLESSQDCFQQVLAEIADLVESQQ